MKRGVDVQLRDMAELIRKVTEDIIPVAVTPLKTARKKGL